MQSDLVMYRTRKGEEALLSHDRGISTNQRRALLVVTGKSTVAELEKTAFWVSDVTSTLKELFALGLVHHDPSALDTEMSRAEGAARLIKAELATVARELLGSNAERIIRKLDEAEGTPEALEQVLLGCKKLIKLTINEEMADTFLQRGLKVIGK